MIIEIVLTDTPTSHVYPLSGRVGTTHPVITLILQDVNHDHKPDLLIQVEGMSYDVLYNTGTVFSEKGA